jgi:hypothetical protein
MDLIPSKPWWQSDDYTMNLTLPGVWFDQLAGPHGVMVVQAFDDGRTEPGWSLQSSKEDGPTFFDRYNELTPKRQAKTFARYTDMGKPFAYVMRSMALLCIDIDGKNGGFEGVKDLGLLPPTVAETSKSGTGYHLFYKTDETWDPEKGFAKFSDRIGIAQGVDIRAVGCVYHHSTQRWTRRELAELPRTLEEKLLHYQQQRAASTVRLQTIINEGDPVELAMERDELITELKRPIGAGRRNNTLFGIGVKMKTLAVPNWEDLIKARAFDVGLDRAEINALIKNIGRQP